MYLIPRQISIFINISRLNIKPYLLRIIVRIHCLTALFIQKIRKLRTRLAYTFLGWVVEKCLYLHNQVSILYPSRRLLKWKWLLIKMFRPFLRHILRTPNKSICGGASSVLVNVKCRLRCVKLIPISSIQVIRSYTWTMTDCHFRCKKTTIVDPMVCYGEPG